MILPARESFRRCRRIAHARARNFYATFLLSSPRRRDALCAVYATLRAFDDVADGPGDAAAKRSALREWRAAIEAAGRGLAGGHPVLPALVETLRRFAIPSRYFHLLLEGAEMDLDVRRYPTFEDLTAYCYRVASSVGLICLHVLGFRDERARARAEDCGLAFQLTNILRDVGEDAARGRIYLPLEDLRRFGCTEEQILRRQYDERFAALMSFEAARARTFYEKARSLPSLVDRPGRATLRAMMALYSGILRKIERSEFRVFGPRVRLSGVEKAGLLFGALARGLLPESAPAS